MLPSVPQLNVTAIDTRNTEGIASQLKYFDKSVAEINITEHGDSLLYYT
jgi:hypothetical protein